MATKNPGKCDQNEIEILINVTFDLLVTELNRKRFEILFQFRAQLNEVESQRIARIKSINELESVLKQLEDSLHENRIQDMRESTILQIQKRINNLESEEIPLDISFSAPDISNFQQFLNDNYKLFIESEYCEETSQNKDEYYSNLNSSKYIQQNIRIDYSTKRKAQRVIGKTGKETGELDGPMKLAFDKIQEHLYVPDANNRRIQVFNLDGEFVREFGSDILKFPCSVAINSSACFVADSQGKVVYKLTLPNFEFIAEQKYTPGCEKTELSYPVDIKIDLENGYIYVADLENERICIFTNDLEFKSEFGKGQLKNPQYIQFYDSRIFVLDGGDVYFLHQFSCKAEFELSIKKMGIGYQIINPKSFCFDPECGNIIVTDFDADTIKVFSFIRSNALKLIQMIGSDRPESEVVDGCMGVVLVNGSIIVSCQRPQSCLKVI